MNAKLQQAGDRRKATWLDPLGATEFPPKYADKEENEQEDRETTTYPEKGRRGGGGHEYIIASEDGSS